MVQSISLATVEDTIYDWIVSRVKSTVTVIFEKENAPRPRTPYISINFITGPIKIGHDEIRHDISDTYNHVGQRELTASIKSYGTTYLQEMTDLQASLNLRSVHDLFRSKDISFLRAEDISDISTEIETGFENRANLDVTFGLRTNLSEDIGFIESVEVDPLYNTPSGGTIDPPIFTVTGI